MMLVDFQPIKCWDLRKDSGHNNIGLKLDVDRDEQKCRMYEGEGKKLGMLVIH